MSAGASTLLSWGQTRIRRHQCPSNDTIQGSSDLDHLDQGVFEWADDDGGTREAIYRRYRSIGHPGRSWARNGRSSVDFPPSASGSQENWQHDSGRLHASRSAQFSRQQTTLPADGADAASRRQDSDVRRRREGQGKAVRPVRFHSVPTPAGDDEAVSAAMSSGRRSDALERCDRDRAPLSRHYSNEKEALSTLSPELESIASLQGSDTLVDDAMKTSLPQRSIQSLRHLASAWTSYPSSTPSGSQASARQTVQQPSFRQGSMPSSDTLMIHPRGPARPVRLDRRRLDKAVSLAVEAAQAAEEDEKSQMRGQLLDRQAHALSAPASGRSSPRLGAFRGLGWSSKVVDDALVTSSGIPHMSRQDGDETANGYVQMKQDSELFGASDQSGLPDSFTLELYISSLGYFLSALRPEDTDALPAEQREQLVTRLRQALEQVDGGQRATHDVISHEEEVILLRMRRDIDAITVNAHGNIATQAAKTGLTTADGPSLRSSVSRYPKTVAGYVASSALGLGLHAGASLIAAASRSIDALLPTLDDENLHGSREVAVEAEENEETPTDRSEAICNTSGKTDSAQHAAVLTSAQWDLTKALASSVASTIYSQLATMARETDESDSGSKKQRQPLAIADAPDRSDAQSLVRQSPEDGSDRLMLMSASLARSIKRSPLPSQVRTLASQVMALAGAIDRRYSLSQRSADMALRKTGEAMSYVRRNDLHVKAVRVAWNVVEASIVAVEAYRNEEGWQGGAARSRTRSLPTSRPPALQVASPSAR